MPEVAFPGQNHGQAALVGRLDHLFVAHRATRLDGRRCARGGSGNQSVGNGKKASLATALPAKGKPASPAFHTAIRTESTRDIWPAPIPSVRSGPARQWRWI
jgi:hypothetical protein